MELLGLLSGPLRLELQKELRIHFLHKHEFFHFYEQASVAAITRLCVAAVDKSFFSKGDIIFKSGEEASLRCVSQGGMTYMGI